MQSKMLFAVCSNAMEFGLFVVAAVALAVGVLGLR